MKFQNPCHFTDEIMENYGYDGLNTKVCTLLRESWTQTGSLLGKLTQQFSGPRFKVDWVGIKISNQSKVVII